MQNMRRLLAAILLLTLALPVAYAQDWGAVASISTTMGVKANRLCVGEASRGDIGCPTYAPSLTTTGDVAFTGGLTTSYISLTTVSTTWGYLGSAASYLPNLGTNAISTTNISLTTINGQPLSSFGSSSPTNVPAFRVNKGGTNQTVVANTWTKITFNTKEFDTYTNFDTGTSRFTPTVAGNYVIIGRLYCDTGATSCYAGLYKNGAVVDSGGAGTNNVANVSTIIKMNGTTDYLELYGTTLGSTNIRGDSIYTTFSGSLLASGNGLVSGTGVTALSALTDVNVTTPTSGTVLTYNGTSSKWEALAATGGLGYAITSGTTNVTANSATSVISLTTAGTTWGYLGSTASYIPNLGTNAISTTNISLTTINGQPLSSFGSSSPTNVPAFRVTKGGTDQSIATSTGTKLTWSTKVYDTYNSFSTATGRFTPTVAGYYYVYLAVGCNGTMTSGQACSPLLYKNGSSLSSSASRSTAGQIYVGVSDIVYLNGSTDYLEAYGYNEASSASIMGSQTQTYFTGSLLASGNGLISGTGVSSLSALTDVTVSSPTSGSVLTYNAATSKWANVPLANVMSTTTIDAGWPDAIRCQIGGNYYNFYARTLGQYALENGSSYWYAVFANNTTATATFSTNSTTPTYCDTKTIPQLYADGNAFNFIGGSGSTAGLGYAITSGTTAVTVNSATGVTSLTTAGTTWGYLGSTGSYLPNLGTNAISTTNISLTTINGQPLSSFGSSSPTNVPAFRGSLITTAQTGVTANTWTKVILNNEDYDTYNNFTTASSRFTPTVAGYYDIAGSVYCGTGPCYAGIYKNGTLNSQSGNSNAATSVSQASNLVYMNGSSDYIELYGYTGGTSFGQGTALTFLTGALVASGNGLISGTGVTALSALTDVNTASASLGSVLQYDGTKWNAVSTTALISGSQIGFSVNKNGTDQTVAASTVTKLTWSNKVFDTNNSFSTSTGRFTPTIPGIYLLNLQVYCSDSTSFCQMYFYKNGVHLFNTFSRASAAVTNLSVLVNMNGTTDYIEAYASNAAGTTISGLSTSTIFQGVLVGGMGSGSGSGATSLSGLTDVGLASPVSGDVLTYNATTSKWQNTPATGGLGYAITSGTTSVTANSTTSVISLTTAATTWGYLGSNASYLPNLGTNAISTTNISLTTINGLPYTGSGLASPTNVPAFRVNKGGTNQTGFPASTFTKLTFNTKDLDTYSGFNTTTSRYTPTVAGNYQFNATLDCPDSATTGCFIGIFKNGLLFQQAGAAGTTGVANPSVATVISMNGSTDYVEAYGWISGATYVSGVAAQTNFSGSLLASGNGLISGTGVTPAGSTGQVQYNTSGALDASPNFTFTSSTQTLSTTNVNANAVQLNDNAAATCGAGTYNTMKVVGGRLYLCVNR